MNLVIDIGNTQTKCGVFSGKKLVGKFIFKTFSKSNLQSIFKKHSVTHCILSTVAAYDTSVDAFLKSNSKTIYLNHKTKLPIKNLYATPGTLGLDRLANVVGAYCMFQKHNSLIIDAGTCIKFDFINNKKEYLGGAISPGINMRFQSLNHYTDKLPLIKPQVNPALTGSSTKSSIASGVQNGALAEIEFTIARYRQTYKTLKVILTGGDSGLFAGMIKSNIFAAPNLTLTGLNEILNFNIASEDN